MTSKPTVPVLRMTLSTMLTFCPVLEAVIVTADVSDYSGGTGVSGDSRLIGGQNSPLLSIDLSNQLSYVPSGATTQTYALAFQIGISEPGTSTARGFEISQGNYGNGVAPNFRFIDNHSGGNFVLHTGQGGQEFSTDDSGNSWSLDAGSSDFAPFQAGESFEVYFQVEFYFPGVGDQNDRQFDYLLEVTRSDPGNIVAIDSLTFTQSRTSSGTSFINDLGQIAFRGSGVGGTDFEGSVSNLIVANEAFSVPEPSSALLLLMVVGGSLVLGRNRTQ